MTPGMCGYMLAHLVSLLLPLPQRNVLEQLHGVLTFHYTAVMENKTLKSDISWRDGMHLEGFKATPFRVPGTGQVIVVGSWSTGGPSLKAMQLPVEKAADNPSAKAEAAYAMYLGTGFAEVRTCTKACFGVAHWRQCPMHHCSYVHFCTMSACMHSRAQLIMAAGWSSAVVCQNRHSYITGSECRGIATATPLHIARPVGCTM